MKKINSTARKSGYLCILGGRSIPSLVGHHPPYLQFLQQYFSLQLQLPLDSSHLCFFLRILQEGGNLPLKFLSNTWSCLCLGLDLFLAVIFTLVSNMSLVIVIIILIYTDKWFVCLSMCLSAPPGTKGPETGQNAPKLGRRP